MTIQTATELKTLFEQWAISAMQWNRKTLRPDWKEVIAARADMLGGSDVPSSELMRLIQSVVDDVTERPSAA